ncbi:hypothetical protein [Streptomyces vietnamensis]|uniref:Secreted protein n=1 Tax=Streptomyces vietnamensis TaxID=362257 RepID=A0A0B5I6P7_9ACTN|nr:hypothetical protein [Streptomyces vietnamensis]AJF65338.1 hypothetical protein SVTN_13860 [Streptomyces vietnamensis]
MRRGLVHALAWSLATGAAVTLSWWGVHTVLSGTVYDPPRALPLPAGGTIGAPASGDDPQTSATRSPATAPPSAPAAPKSTPSEARTPPTPPSATPSRRPTPTAEAPTTTPPPDAGTNPGSGADSGVKTYTVDGGRVTFDLGETSAELVSATPASGWQMQVWKQPTWIRVTFTEGGRELSVFCVWHDTAPRVEIDDRQT